MSVLLKTSIITVFLTGSLAKGDLAYSESEVEVYHRYERIAVHKRNRHPFGHTTVNDHLASQHRFLSDWNP
jgi:hypothetical protein